MVASKGTIKESKSQLNITEKPVEEVKRCKSNRNIQSNKQPGKFAKFLTVPKQTTNTVKTEETQENIVNFSKMDLSQFKPRMKLDEESKQFLEKKLIELKGRVAI